MLAAVVLSACTHAPPDATPEGAVREWLGHMAASIDDSRETKAAYELMGPASRANLEERASRASQVEGRRVEPHEMLAHGHFGLRFRPRKVHATIDTEGAAVEITGADPQERAQLRCVRGVAGSGASVWRVEPDLPEPQILVKRDSG